MASAAVYMYTPYILSCFYGRSAVPETLAHCELPFLALGLLLACRGLLLAAICCIGAAVGLLALTHPVFLLYGCAWLGLCGVISLSRHVFCACVIGGVAGLLLSAFQWYPAFLSRDLLGVNFALSSGLPAHLTSAVGLCWWPAPLGMTFELRHLFLTPSWLTLPVASLLVLAQLRRPSAEQRIVLASLICFGVLSFSPLINVYDYMPRVFWSVQYPYRLLAFFALFTALGVPLVWPHLPVGASAFVIGLATLQSIELITTRSYSTPVAVTGDLGGMFPLRDYVINAAGHGGHLASGDGWLVYDNLVRRREGDGAALLRLTGVTGVADGPTDVWLVDIGDPSVGLTPRIAVGPGGFDVSIPLPDRAGVFRVMVSRFFVPALLDAGSSDTRKLSLNLTYWDIVPIVPGLWSAYGPPPVLPDRVERTVMGPTTRRFSVRSETSLFATGSVELPIAFSPFFEFRQDGRALAVRPSGRGLAVVATRDLSRPIDAAYRMPGLCLAGPILLGALALLGLIWQLLGGYRSLKRLRLAVPK